MKKKFPNSNSARGGRLAALHDSAFFCVSFNVSKLSGDVTASWQRRCHPPFHPALPLLSFLFSSLLPPQIRLPKFCLVGVFHFLSGSLEGLHVVVSHRTFVVSLSPHQASLNVASWDAKIDLQLRKKKLRTKFVSSLETLPHILKWRASHFFPVVLSSSEG